MTKKWPNSTPMRLVVWLLKVFIGVPATIFGYVVGVPLTLIVAYVARKHCPRCGKRSLSSALGRHGAGSEPYDFYICLRCNSQYRHQDGRWEYSGPYKKDI